jgi:hypothetical protein
MLSIYKASAGSGKTYALTREYIRMLLSDRVCRDMRLPHSRILAVTFTKKSTAEMKERILKELYILAKDPKESSYISDYLSDKDIDLNQEEIQQRAQLLLVGILQLIVNRPVQPPNARSPIRQTEVPIIVCSNDQQSSKAQSLIRVTLLGIITLLSE